MLGLLGGAAFALTAFTGTAQAQDWEPTKPIDFVIMAGAGGGADQIARFLQSVAEKEDLTNRPLVPNNKGGGSGAEALIALNGTNDPDHTILVTLNSFFTTPLRQENLGIDVYDLHAGRDDGRRSVRALGPQGQRHHRPSTSGSKRCTACGGEYVMGGTGTGQEDSLVIPSWRTPTTSTSSTSPMTAAARWPRTSPVSRSWRASTTPPRPRASSRPATCVPLIAFSDERLPAFPDVPTVKEHGEDFSYYNQRAVVGAPGQSAEAAAYYQTLFETIYNTPEWQGYMESESLSPLWMNPEEQTAYWQHQIERHRELLAEMEQ